MDRLKTAEQAEIFAKRYARLLDALTVDTEAKLPERGAAKLDCVRLCALREACLRSEGFEDIYRDVKQSENGKALSLLPCILSDIDSEDRLDIRFEKLLHGVFAGNIFDMGAVASESFFREAGSHFLDTRRSLVSRPWAVDDFDKVLQQLCHRKYHKVLIFVDNAGPDIVLGILPLARELVQRGSLVVLAANSLPSVNDVTAPELVEILQKAACKDERIKQAAIAKSITAVESGNDLPVIDLSKVSVELVRACEGVDLVILEGMGRAIETNLNAQMKCDKINLGMIKHMEVAQALSRPGAPPRLFDCVCKFTAGSDP